MKVREADGTATLQNLMNVLLFCCFTPPIRTADISGRIEVVLYLGSVPFSIPVLTSRAFMTTLSHIKRIVHRI